MDDLTGKKLGPYQIVSPLGEGGMAAVYKAFQPSVNRYVAVKVLPQYFARDPQFAARFEREAQVLAQLQHPNILPVFDYGTATEDEGGKYTYIAMPLIKGGSLENLMHNQRLEYKTIRKIMTQVGDALDYAHSLNLIHRDVKPANILIDERGNCLLTDFGLARMVEGTAKLTSSGAVMGTPAYMSPEQGKGLVLDRRTDIYSLGIILFELAVGRPPFEGDTPMVMVVKHINDPLPLPSSLVPSFPEPLERVIVKALAKDREERYATASAFVEALNAAFDQIERAAPTPQTAPVKPPSTHLAAPSVVAASPRVPTAPPPPANKSLIQRAWWVFPLGGLIALLALVIVGGAGAFAINQFLKRTPTVVATEVSAATSEPTPITITFPPEDTPEVTLEATQAADAELLNEDFENGESQGWLQISGNDTSEIVQLSDGNHVAHVTQGDSGGGASIYTPAFDWSDSDYSIEVDVMVVDPIPGQTTIRLNARIPGSTPEQSCLGYAAVIGAGWTSLDKIQTPDNNCETSDWEENTLAPVSDFELNSEEWHHLRLDVQGNNLQYYLDDTLIASANDFVDTWRSGGIGISAYHYKEIYLDNFQIHAHPDPLADLDQSNWTVSFTRYFSPDIWTAGDHTYSMNLNCPGLEDLNNSVTQRFSTADDAEAPPDSSAQLYLTDEGVRYIFIDGAPVEQPFNPAYTTLAVYNQSGITQEQATQATIRCDATMSWDDNGGDTLQPVMVFQH